MAKKKTKNKSLTKKPAQVQGTRIIEPFLYFLLLGWLPFLFVCLLQLEQPRSQNFLFLFLVLSMGLSWWLGKVEKQAFKIETPYVSEVLLFSFLLMALLIIWNYLFRLYLSEVDFTQDIFRPKFRNFHAPLYGYPRMPEPKQLFYPILSAGLFLAYMLRKGKGTIEGWGILTSVFFLILLSSSLALKDHVSRLADWMGSYGAFTQGLDLFSDIPDLLRNYTSTMGQLGVHSKHYPPGIALLMRAEQLWNVKMLTRFMVMASGVGTIYVVRNTATLLGLPTAAAQLAVLFFILSPGILSYFTVDPAFIVLFPASLTFYFYVRGLMTGRVVCAIAMGLFFSLYTFFSFSSGFLALLMGIFFLIAWRWGIVTLTEGLMQIGLSVAAFVSFYVLLYSLTGFQLIDCLREAIRNNTEQMSSGFDDVFRYLLRSTGAILAYLTVTGFPQSFFSARALLGAVKGRNNRNWSDVLAVAVPTCLLVSAFSGYFFLETERVWLFFTPILVISSGGEGEVLYRRLGFRPMAAFIVGCLVLAVFYELFLRSFAWR
jgi:hypothetical protein